MTFSNPTIWMLFAIIVVTLWVRGDRQAAAGLACYALSFALSTAYTLTTAYGMAVPVWQFGLLLILIMYGIVGKLWWPAVIGAAGLSLHHLDLLSRRPAELLIMLLIATSVYLIYRTVKFTNPQGKLIWVIILIAEGWAAIEYASCQFVSQPDVTMLVENWGVTVSKYSCGRAFGPAAPYMAPTLTTLALIWVGARWNFRRQR